MSELEPPDLAWFSVGAPSRWRSCEPFASWDVVWLEGLPEGQHDATVVVIECASIASLRAASTVVPELSGPVMLLLSAGEIDAAAFLRQGDEVCLIDSPPVYLSHRLLAMLHRATPVDSTEYHELRPPMIRDSMTGVYARWWFERQLKRILAAGAPGRYQSLILIDIDRMKRFNDTHGHLLGDDLLREAARRIAVQFPGVAMIGRIEADVFAACIPTPLAEGRVQAERVWRCMRETPFVLSEELLLNMTVSVGVASNHGLPLSVTQLFYMADMCLYRAKNLGRDQVVDADELLQAAAAEGLCPAFAPLDEVRARLDEALPWGQSWLRGQLLEVEDLDASSRHHGRGYLERRLAFTSLQAAQDGWPLIAVMLEVLPPGPVAVSLRASERRSLVRALIEQLFQHQLPYQWSALYQRDVLCLVMTNLVPRQVRRRLERCHDAIQAQIWTYQEGYVTFSVRLGGAVWRVDEEISTFLLRAWQACTLAGPDRGNVLLEE